MQWFEADNAKAQFIFAHGAGAGMQSDFMQTLAKLMSEQGVRVGLFDFEYMQLAKQTNKRRPPDRAPKLIAYFAEQLADVDPELPLFIGGKSMGGRMASMLVAEQAHSVKGVVAFGYPFHPPGKKEKLRVAHFEQIDVPFCVIQGERDTFGKKDELSQLANTDPAQIYWIEDGDHSLVPRKRSGLTEQQNWQNAANIAVQFITDNI